MASPKNTPIPKPEINSLAADIPKPKKTEPKKWRFSFLYWKQIDYFGLECQRVSKNWFVALLERLQTLSSKTIEEVTQIERGDWRWHPLNWNQPKIPIQKSSLYWIPNDILNSEETEFHQFQISMALGRVIGFFDPDYIFHVVLLDPMHNAQPVQRFNYRVDETRILNSSYQILLHNLRKVRSKIENHCKVASCEVLSIAQSIEEFNDVSRYVLIDEEFDTEISQLIQDYNYDDIFWLLLDAIATLKEAKENNI